MNTKVILGLVAVLAVVGAVAIVFLGKPSRQPSQPAQSGSPAPAGSTTTQATESVTLTSSGFAPQSLTVKVGTKVVWTNQNGTAAAVNSASHPTHLVYPPLNLGNFGNGDTLSLVFDKPGTYKYHNHLNASQIGVVVVE